MFFSKPPTWVFSGFFSCLVFRGVWFWYFIWTLAGHLTTLAPRNNLAAFCQTQGCKAKEEPAVVFQQILQKGHLAPRFIIPSLDIQGHLLRFGIWTLKTYLKLQKSLYYQPKQCTTLGEIPPNYYIYTHLHCLIPPKNGYIIQWSLRVFVGVKKKLIQLVLSFWDLIAIFIAHNIHGTGILLVYLPTWMVLCYGKNVGKYTVRPMDPMGIYIYI